MLPHSSLATVARRYFGVVLPVERKTLTSAYRRACFVHHPDVGGDEDEFKMLTWAYTELTTASSGVFVDGPATQATEEGIPLSELGKGLGTNVNGKTCEKCKGDGYTKKQGVTWHPGLPCDICYAVRSTWGCRKCDGKFKKTEGWIYAICAPCKGTGEIMVLNPVIPKGFLPSGNIGQKARKRLGTPCRECGMVGFHKMSCDTGFRDRPKE